MRLVPYLALGIFLCGPNAFAYEFKKKLKKRETPTIKFTSPEPGQIVSPFNMHIGFERLNPYPPQSLGLLIENVETGKRFFLGDGSSMRENRFSENQKPLNFGFGRFRLIGYHYGRNPKDYSYAGIGPEFTVEAQEETFWTKWNEPERLCPKFSGTKNYRIDDIKHITCEDHFCVSPKFYVDIGKGSWLEDRPIHLPEDKHIIKVTCLTETEPVENLDIGSKVLADDELTNPIPLPALE